MLYQITSEVGGDQNGSHALVKVKHQILKKILPIMTLINLYNNSSFFFSFFLNFYMLCKVKGAIKKCYLELWALFSHHSKENSIIGRLKRSVTIYLLLTIYVFNFQNYLSVMMRISSTKSLLFFFILNIQFLFRHFYRVVLIILS